MSLFRPRAIGPSIQILAVLLLPAVFALLGPWEIIRGNDTATEFSQAHASLTAQIQKVRALAETNPQAIIRFRGDDQAYAAPRAVQMMEEGDNEIVTNETVARGRVPFAWLATAAGLLSLVGGVFGLALVGLAARRSMRSRDALVRAFGQVRRLVPFAMGCQVAGVALALLGAVAFECGGLWFLDTVSGGEVKLVALAVVAAGLALWGAFQSIKQLRRAFELFEPAPAELLGIPVTEAEAPGLFSLVRELARDQEAVVPQTVVAGALAGFFVTSYPQELPAVGRVASGRTLHVSLPQLAVLSRAETRVVLAHELAHFSGDDTAYSIHFQPVYAALQHSMAAVAGRRRRQQQPILDRILRPASALGEHVLGRFDRVVKHWSRLREFEADKGALVTEAPDALATSLLRTAVTSEIVTSQLLAMAERPADAPADLVEQTVVLAERQGFIEPARHLDDRQPHPTDTHPPTVQRIKAAGVAVDEGLLTRAARPVDPGELADAEALFADWAGLCGAVTAQLRGVAIKREQAYLSEVAAAARSVTEAPVELHERRVRMMVTLGITALVCLALAAGFGWLVAGNPPEPGDNTNAVLTSSAVVLALCGLAACFGLLRFARNRAPFLVLHADGFSSPGFKGTVPWSAVAGLTVVGGRGVTTILTLAPTQTLPVRTGKIWRLKTSRRKNTVVLSGLLPRDMKPQAYLDLLARYRRAALARAELARRSREEQPVASAGQRVG